MKFNSYIIYVFAFAIQLAVLCHKKKKENILKRDLYNEHVDASESQHLIKYLGMSYDIIKGNPLGDPKFMVDLGYKKYILSNELNLLDDKNKAGSDMSSATSNTNTSGGATINGNNNFATVLKGKLRCSTHNDKLIISDMKDIDKQYKHYTFSSKYNIHAFNASNYYKMLADRLNRGDSTLIYEKHCIKYYAALKKLDASNLSLFFSNMLKELVKTYNNIYDDSYVCSLDLFRKNKYDDNCLKTITPWITFFNFYGTHLVSAAYFGGKIIQNMFVESDDLKTGGYEKKVDEKRLNPFFNNNNNYNSLYFGSVVSKNKIRYITERNYIINGGDNAVKYENKQGLKESFDKWKNSINAISAKPVNLVLTPFADFIESEEGKISYYKALEFYSNLSYSDYNLFPYKTNGDEQDIYRTEIRNWNQVVNKNVNFNISPKCEKGEKAINGFIITNRKKLESDNNFLHLCTYSNSCASGINIKSDKNFEFGWLLCSKENANNYFQISRTVTGNEIVSCPAKMKVGYGFYMTMQKGINTNMIVKSCKTNKQHCQPKGANNNLNSLVWINCIPDEKQMLLSTLDSKIYSENLFIKKNKNVSLSCEKGSFIIAGFAVDYVPSYNNDYTVCSAGSSSCSLEIRVTRNTDPELHTPIIFIICSSL